MKKGMSTVIAVLLLVLLVVVAVSIIWVIAKVFIDDSLDNASFGERTIDLRIRNVSFNISGDLKVDVQREAGEGEIVGLEFIIEGAGSVVVEEVTDLKQFERKPFTIDSGELGDFVASLVEKVSVAPIFLTEAGKEKTGNVVDVYVFEV